jgi:hypothetical protein
VARVGDRTSARPGKFQSTPISWFGTCFNEPRKASPA